MIMLLVSDNCNSFSKNLVNVLHRPDYGGSMDL